MEHIVIDGKAVSIKEYNGQRVLTMSDVDALHGRLSGTARKRFNDNRSRFTEGIDYYKVTPQEIRSRHILDLSPNCNSNITLLTESGYRLLVHCFSKGQNSELEKEMVTSYFHVNPVLDYKKLSPNLQMFYHLFQVSAKLEARVIAVDKKLSEISDLIDTWKGSNN